MKAYLIQYDLNYNGYTGLLGLVYANSYEDAVEKLRADVEKMVMSDAYGTTGKLINHRNLTIE